MTLDDLCGERFETEEGVTVFWPKRFAALVDEYTSEHGLTKSEVFRQVAAVRGNSVKTVSLRYYKDKRWA